MNKLFIALLLGVSLILPRAASAAAAKPSGITQISVQRTWCYGVCPIDELVLNSDGSATYSGFSHAPRSGFFKGALPPDQFSKLTAFLEEQNFFELKPEIGFGNIDAADFIVSVTRDRLPYAVTFRIGGSQKLTEKMKKTLLGVGEGIGWQRDEAASQNGIKGTVRRPLTPSEAKMFSDRKPPVISYPMQFTFVTLRPRSGTGEEITTLSDQEGRFQFFAPPGSYDLSASLRNSAERFRLDGPRLYADSQTVRVENGKFATPIVRFEDKTSPNR